LSAFVTARGSAVYTAAAQPHKEGPDKIRAALVERITSPGPTVSTPPAAIGRHPPGEGLGQQERWKGRTVDKESEAAAERGARNKVDRGTSTYVGKRSSEFFSREETINASTGHRNGMAVFVSRLQVASQQRQT